MLRRVGQQLGLDPTQSSDFAAMVDLINSAAQQVYRETDAVGALMEQTFQVAGNMQLSFPHDVGFIRALREYETWRPWTLQDMRPRYSYGNWKTSWKHFRVKGTRPTCVDSLNTGILTYSAAATESPSPAVVTAVGQTAQSSRITETVTLSSASVQGTNQFTQIFGFYRSSVGDYDINITNLSGQLLSTITNNALKANYTIVDVSNYPFQQLPTNNTWQYMEVLYKQALPYLYNPYDEFPGQGYDDIIVDKTLQLRAEQNSNAQEAQMRDQKVTRELARKDLDASGGQQQTIGFIPQEIDNLVRKNPQLNFRRTPYRR